VLDHAKNEKYQVRVIVYGVHTLNKPTLDKPGITIYDSQCKVECSINAGIWSFTDWKVNNGDKIKACALDTATSHQSCGYGSADKSRTDSLYIPLSASTHPAPINWDKLQSVSQSTLTTINNSLTDTGQISTIAGNLGMPLTGGLAAGFAIGMMKG
jgi:hypothetical protein